MIKILVMTLLNKWNDKIKEIPIIRNFWDKSFLHYAWGSGLFSLANIFFLWLFIDIIGIPTILSSIIVIGGTFILRYFLFRFLKVM